MENGTMAPKENDCNRRKQDTIDYKIKQMAALIGACAIIAGGASWLGSTKFTTKEETAPIVERLIKSEKDILVIQTQQEAILTNQKETNLMIREIRESLRSRP